MKLPRPVDVGRPLWWLHAVALLWMGAGVSLLYNGLVHEAGLCFLACLTTSLPAILFLFGKIEQSE
jgi:hypothetical protein